MPWTHAPPAGSAPDDGSDRDSSSDEPDGESTAAHVVAAIRKLSASERSREVDRAPELESQEGSDYEAALPAELPTLPTRDLVLFPGMVAPVVVGRAASTAAVEQALADGGDRLVFVCLQRRGDEDHPSAAGLHSVGTVASIRRTSTMVDGRIKVTVQGLCRARAQRFLSEVPYFCVSPAPMSSMAEHVPALDAAASHSEQTALIRQIQEDLGRYSAAGKLTTAPGLVDLARDVDPERADLLSDLLCGNLPIPAPEAQRLLEEGDALRRLRAVAEHLRKEVLLLDLQEGIRARTRDVLSRAQREHYLREQLRQIQNELSGDGGDDLWGLRDQLARAGLSGEARAESERQLRRLESLPSGSPESQVIRAHLEWLAELPWQACSEDHFDLLETRRVLDEEHHGLDQIKDRILEFLSVVRLRQRVLARDPEQRSLGQILCFAGPPGVGKTSLGRSIARALGRRFVRVMLGGVRDDAEIRGHRRTYVGAMPGRLLQGLRQAGTRNPVVLLDEIDKLVADAHGDPSAALLEVLDPEQNGSFRDHYLGVPFNLSDVLFIATANDIERIPVALRDRLELLILSGYTEEEKLAIAARHIVPRALSGAALAPTYPVAFTKRALHRLIVGYTCEAGVRALERQISAVCRKIAHSIVAREDALSALATLPGIARGPALPEVPQRIVISERTLERYLGPPRRPLSMLPRPSGDGEKDIDRIGIALGLAWTPVGGEVLEIESQWMPGHGDLRLTGQLGEVMRESAQTALSFARACLATHGLPDPSTSGKEVHIHVPGGAVPKDGPSAGVTLACALVSLLSHQPLRAGLAMTGEVTLRGRVLAVGGIKEKLLAARRAGVREVVLPRANEADLRSLPRPLLRALTLHLVDEMAEVLAIALPGWAGPAPDSVA
jgi:ATP-dependent Lon protease